MWSPDKSTGGTSFPIHSAGLLYCGYSNKPPSNDSVLPEASLVNTPGTIRAMASIITMAGSSPPVRT